MLGVIQKQYRLYYGRRQIRKHGVWYIDIPRTSSATIKTELGLIYGAPYGKAKLVNKQHWYYAMSKDDVEVMRKLRHHSNLIFGDHIPAIEIQKKIGEKLWEKIFTFTFVRNPWDRMLSLYFAMKKWGEISGDMQFRDYILALRDDHKRSEKRIFRLPVYYFGSSDYILDASGEILVNFIGKFENRSDDLKIVAQRLGSKRFGTLEPIFVKPRPKSYTEYYDLETREIVGQIYRKDVELFDYQFDL